MRGCAGGCLANLLAVALTRPPTPSDLRRMIATVRLSRGDTPCQDEAELWRELLATGAEPSEAERRRIAAVDAILPHHVAPTVRAAG